MIIILPVSIVLRVAVEVSETDPTQADATALTLLRQAQGGLTIEWLSPLVEIVGQTVAMGLVPTPQGTL